jgi:spermidine synthase
VLYHREGASATVVVFEWKKKLHAVRINGRVNASDDPDDDMPTQVLSATLPLLLVPRASDAFLLGWGSGVSAGAALQGPIERLTAVELEPAVVEGSRFFLHVNHDPLRDPRLRLYEDDARHILLASEDTYDVMISEPSHPWSPGVAAVFTQDFFALAARRLREDGIFAQWLQGYQMSVETFRSILATFQSVFPEVIIYSPSDAADWILLGSRRPLRFDLADLDRRWQDERLRAENARVNIRRPEHLLAGVYVGPEGVRKFVAGATLNTDDNVHVEFRAPRDMIAQDVSGGEITDAVREHLTPLETMVTDPALLLGSRDRLQALVEGLKRQGMDTARYEAFLARLD